MIAVPSLGETIALRGAHDSLHALRTDAAGRSLCFL